MTHQEITFDAPDRVGVNIQWVDKDESSTQLKAWLLFNSFSNDDDDSSGEFFLERKEPQPVDEPLARVAAKSAAASKKYSIVRKMHSQSMLELPEAAGKAKAIKAATLTKLVEKMTDPAFVKDQSVFDAVVLYSFHSFTDRPTLWSLLTQRFAQSGDTRVRRLCVLAVRHWVELHRDDFADTKEVDAWIAHIECDQELQGALQKLKDALVQLKQEARDEVPMLAEVGKGTGIDHVMDHAEEFSPMLVAGQLTILEWEMMRNIAPKEFLNQHWAKVGKQRNAPGLVRYIEWFNRSSRMLGTLILSGSTAAKRGRLIADCIKMADTALGFKNYNLVMSTLGCLGHSAIARLKKSWALVDTETQSAYQSMCKLFSPEKNYSAYRKALKEDTFALPYLGVFLTDLTFIDDSNPKLLSNNLVNIEKAQMSACVIGMISYLVAGPVPIAQNSRVRQWILDAPVSSEDDLYAASLLREPRGEETPAPPVDHLGLRRTMGRSSFAREQPGKLRQLDVGPAEIDNHDWKLIMAADLVVPFVKDDVIMEQGNHNDKIFRIKGGQCRVEVNGRMVAKLNALAVFGEMSVLGVDEARATASVIGNSNGEVQVGAVSYLQALFRQDPGIFERFFKFTAVRLAKNLRSMDASKYEEKQDAGLIAERKRSVDQRKRKEAAERGKSDQEYQGLFKLPPGEPLLKTIREISWQALSKWSNATMYLSSNFVCLNARVLGMERKERIPLVHITSIDHQGPKIKIGWTKLKKRLKTFIRGGDFLDGKVYDLLVSLWTEKRNQLMASATPSMLKASLKSQSQSQEEKEHSLAAKENKMQGEDWELILSGAKEMHCVKGDVIVSQNSEYPAVFYITKGICRIEIDNDGVKEDVGEMHPDEMFGEVSMLLGGAASGSVIAQTDQVDLLVIEGYMLRVLFECQPDLPGKFFHWISKLLTNRIKKRELGKTPPPGRKLLANKEDSFLARLDAAMAKKPLPARSDLEV